MNIFQKYLVDEFAEDYAEGRLSRREALKMIASITGSVAVAAGILAACAPAETPPTEAADVQPAASDTPAAAPSDTPVPPTPEPTEPPASPAPTEAASTEVAATEVAATAAPAQAGTVSPDDPAVQAGAVEFPAPDGATLMGYLARPAALSEGEAAPVILVCHENRGLTPHIEDVARRLAKAGYVALAVDLLSRQGGTPSLSSSDVPGLLGNTPADQFVTDFLAGLDYLRDQPFADTERLGMVGFCFGGGVTWRMATRVPELDAAVPFYGPHPPEEDVPNIQAAVLGIYAENDTRINQGIPAIEAAMQAGGKTYEKVIYPGTSHAFHNDTGSRYAPEAAADAWARTLAWFEQYVRM